MFGSSTITGADMIAGIGATSGPAITWLLPVVYVALGIPLAFYIVKGIISLVKTGFGKKTV